MDEDKTLHSKENTQISTDSKDERSKELMDYEGQKYFQSKDDYVSKDVEDEGYESNNDEDDDERFVKKDADLKEVSESIMQDIVSDLDEYHKDLEGIRPMANKARSLSHELGGLEVAEYDGVSEEDVWDNRYEEVEAMADGETDRLSNTNTSSLRKSFIHRKKQEKRIKKGQEDAKDAIEASEGGRTLNLLEARNDGKASHVDRLGSQNSSGSRGGRGI